MAQFVDYSFIGSQGNSYPINFVIPSPAGVQEDDLLIFTAATVNTGVFAAGTPSLTFNDSSGWTTEVAQGTARVGINLLAAKLAPASPQASYDITVSGLVNTRAFDFYPVLSAWRGPRAAGTGFSTSSFALTGDSDWVMELSTAANSSWPRTRVGFHYSFVFAPDTIAMDASEVTEVASWTDTSPTVMDKYYLQLWHQTVESGTNWPAASLNGVLTGDDSHFANLAYLQPDENDVPIFALDEGSLVYTKRHVTAKALPYQLTTGDLKGVPWHEMNDDPSTEERRRS